MSVPYLTDKYVVDHLCRFAKPENGGLQIYIILGPRPFKRQFLQEFIPPDKEAQIRNALSRLHIKVFGTDDGSSTSNFSHSKGIVSTAGAMIGSYNYTARARIRHFEHSILLEPTCEATIMLRNELSAGWNHIASEELSFASSAKREAPTGGEASNPYGPKKPAFS